MDTENTLMVIKGQGVRGWVKTFFNVKIFFLNVRMDLFSMSSFIIRHSFTTFHES